MQTQIVSMLIRKHDFRRYKILSEITLYCLIAARY